MGFTECHCQTVSKNNDFSTVLDLQTSTNLYKLVKSKLIYILVKYLEAGI
jgi:hypothetical protein